MADQKITDLTALSGTDVTDSDVVPIVDVAPAATTKKMTRTEFFKNTPPIGIGTSSPNGTITMRSSLPHLDFWESDGSAGFNNTVLLRSGDVFAVQTRGDDAFVSNDYRITSNASGALTHEWRIGNAEAMRIDSGGNVGIGTSSPNSPLHVESGAGGGGDVWAGRLATFTSFTPGLFFKDMSSGAQNFLVTADSSAFAIRSTPNTDGTSLSEIFTLLSSGNLGVGINNPSEKLDVSGNVTISGSLSKGSGSFKIDHPLKPETHHLVHSFLEGPQADNLYRGKVTLVDGAATVNLDEAARMTEGTFVALNGNVQCFTTNEDGWTQVRGSVTNNILTIEAQDPTCTDTVSWLVIGERHDQHMLETPWTDESGRVITEPEKVIVEDGNP